MSNNKLVGRKVRLVEDCLFYYKGCPYGNKGVILSALKADTEVLVNVQDGAGCVIPYYPNEVRYLNNRPVVVADD